MSFIKGSAFAGLFHVLTFGLKRSLQPSFDCLSSHHHADHPSLKELVKRLVSAPFPLRHAHFASCKAYDRVETKSSPYLKFETTLVKGSTITTDEWAQVSQVLDYLLSQPTNESLGAEGVRGEPEKPRQKTKRQNPKEQPAEQLRLF